MTLDLPGAKTWAPFGDPSTAETQRSPEAFQSLDLDTVSVRRNCSDILVARCSP